MKYVLTLFSLTVIGVVLLTAAQPASGASAGTATGSPNATIHTTVQDLMIALVDPSADAIWESVGVIETKEGIEERQPRSEEDWQALHVHAVRLLEGAKLLSATKRKVAEAGEVSENPGIELDPSQSEWLIVEQPAVWQAMAVELQRQSESMLRAIKQHDAKAIFDGGEALDQACEGCHRHFWYPDNVNEVPRVDSAS